MTQPATTFASKAIKLASTRTDKTRKVLRRNRLAYLGLHGMAFDQVRSGAFKLQKEREVFLADLIAKGESIEAEVVNLFKATQEKAEDLAEDGRARVWNMLPGSTVNRVEELEAELEAAKKKLKTIARKPSPKTKAKKTTIKKTARKSTPVKKGAVQVSGEGEPAVNALNVPATTSAVQPPEKIVKSKVTPRHIPYFNDVKRYDPLANEDIVRKIVNHCGIALSSQDARYVACTDETERNRVRDSWLKKKLGVEGADTDLDKKVQNVCSIMQRDTLKNRVTFYYLAAKAERKLDRL